MNAILHLQQVQTTDQVTLKLQLNCLFSGGSKGRSQHPHPGSSILLKYKFYETKLRLKLAPATGTWKSVFSRSMDTFLERHSKTYFQLRFFFGSGAPISMYICHLLLSKGTLCDSSLYFYQRGEIIGILRITCHQATMLRDPAL